MLRNKDGFHLSKSDVKAYDILYSESLVFCMDNVQKYVFMKLLFCIRWLVHMVVHCENMHNVVIVTDTVLAIACKVI